MSWLVPLLLTLAAWPWLRWRMGLSARVQPDDTVGEALFMAFWLAYGAIIWLAWLTVLVVLA